MNILAFDTSTDACSVALRVADAILVDHRIVRQQHAQLLMPMIDQLMVDAGLTPADLTGVVFGRGPGSFTGVRMAVAAAQGLGMALDIGGLGISTLQCLAQGAFRLHSEHRVLAVLDARMDQVYRSYFEADADGLMQPLEAEAVEAPAPAREGFVAVGSGAERYASVLGCPVHAGLWPEARDLIELAGSQPAWVDAAEALPVYLRNEVAQTEAQRAEL